MHLFFSPSRAPQRSLRRVATIRSIPRPQFRSRREPRLIRARSARFLTLCAARAWRSGSFSARGCGDYHLKRLEGAVHGVKERSGAWGGRRSGTWGGRRGSCMETGGMKVIDGGGLHGAEGRLRGDQHGAARRDSLITSVLSHATSVPAGIAAGVTQVASQQLKLTCPGVGLSRRAPPRPLHSPPSHRHLITPTANHLTATHIDIGEGMESSGGRCFLPSLPYLPPLFSRSLPIPPLPSLFHPSPLLVPLASFSFGHSPFLPRAYHPLSPQWLREANQSFKPKFSV
ncbi:unnamed protein product [Closterium sp. Yama58-4]|nr:unnamed protein product [Closterium sp. Yama58-4]